ncbi:orotidine-5'-phosphate decarboxylase [Coraliomargarita sp. SDUM461003]|uniref:Orotidine 5'-phosphate decarboxylase n=1 Tax=Thalassobacterium maritimum TaxID=3041265 RepID=A0ABU1ART6_9BACT|nr:orotidine-5'-phosphate decarboxylase [Coraliomargarita sp. SDUM461003]MBT63123.1 orotidine-5'-phosphate decarboxylase [Puniceicoccaceae bacterium]MDQ8206878.1 orotidine-5'-phosphate decarboxylase [Coraliomargarita sp. SDUM461003]|tara:strand:+ start:18386 stop:19087 length:702 start_codon:yes stop_codon:yes gene_type:complete
MSKSAPCQLILALDLETREEALAMLDRLGDSLKWVKIGLQLFTAYGPDFVREIADRGYKVFLDLKLHDIPNTVAKAVQSISTLPVDLLTLHACGGGEMLEWANKARADYAPNLNLLAVTVLTSMNEAQLRSLNVASTPEAQVLHLADITLKSGVQGLVCSSLELAPLRERFGQEPIIVTPGIRPAGSAADEQKRIMTPAAAAAAGSSYIVVGRPILKAADPAAAARSIQADLS